MDKTLFETRAISIFNDRKYVFYDELQKGGTLKQMTNSHYAALLAIGALVGFGAFMIDSSSPVDGEVKEGLLKLGSLCDLVGINTSTLSVNLVLFVYGDDLNDETIIGRCHLIHDKLSVFKKFTGRIGWNKMPVSASVFFVFANSQKAFHFRSFVQEHCKHYSLFNKLWVLPWGIDLVAKSVSPYSGLPVNWLKPREIETRLFS